MAERYLTVQFQLPDDTSAEEALAILVAPIKAIHEMMDIEVRAIISHTEPIVLSVPMRPPENEAEEQHVQVPPRKSSLN